MTLEAIPAACNFWFSATAKGRHWPVTFLPGMDGSLAILHAGVSPMRTLPARKEAHAERNEREIRRIEGTNTALGVVISQGDRICPMRCSYLPGQGAPEHLPGEHPS